MDLNYFKRGIFSLPFRRFGAFTQIMIKKLYDYDSPINNFHDLYNTELDQRVEVKFCVVRKKWDSPIDENNVIQAVMEANQGKRVLEYRDRNNFKFDCNMNQVKTAEFEILYYGLFFYDLISIFKIKSSEIGSNIAYSDKQHKGNVGEGQFHINNRTIDFHNPYFEQNISYEKLYYLISNEIDQEGKDLFHEHWQLPLANHQAPMIIPFDLTSNRELPRR